MADAFAENTLKEFDAALDDLQVSLEFADASSKLRPRLGEFLNRAVMRAEANALVDRFFKHAAAEPTPFYRGIVIILGGAFEQFIRGLLHDAVLSVRRSVKKYDALGEHIKKENMRRTGQALDSIFEPLDHFDFDYYELCKNIGTCIPGSEEFMLNANVFSIYVSNLTPEHLTKAVARLGVSLNWDDVGGDAGLQELLGGSGARETANDVQDYLKEFIKNRNKLAHTGSGLTFTSEEVEEFLKFFRLLGKRLVQVLEKQVKKSAKQ
jgi:hypothetical protein